DFPTAGGGPAKLGSGALGASQDAFVAKLNAAGTAPPYSVYLGGSGNEQGNGIAVDASGSAYLTGNTRSTDVPPAGGGAAKLGGGALGASQDAFVAKLNAAGTALTYSVYLGGSASDSGAGIAVDGSGSAYVTGTPFSADFPTAGGGSAKLGGGALGASGD